ncbi:neutral/alkaline non-lysosomal ceramidase N-terminal domain-containing protein, partial [bacterium]|nr:neutral/alkaline non-lysosomal ceramidase N-terminal domain-containing protein [bacterium]
MKVGFGKVVITPPVGFSLAGYFDDRRSEGIRDDLYAICVIFDDGKNIFAVLSCELIWLDKFLVRKVRKIVSKELNIPYSNITIHATHTHTGPVPSYSSNSIFTKNFYVEKSYIELLPIYIAGSVKIAYRNREEVKIGIGSERVEGISFNRRYLLKDGRVITNPFLQIEDIVKSAGPVDNSIGVMKIVNKKGVLKGVIVNFALHPDTLGDNLISADWPGFLRKKIEKKFPGTVAMVLNGPSGDIN